MSRFSMAAVALLLLAACDGAPVEQAVEKRAAEEIAKATGKEASVDLTGEGGTVTVGDDRVDITLRRPDVRRDPPADVPVPLGANVTSVIPGVADDVVRIKMAGALAEVVAAYDRQARDAGYRPEGTPLVVEGMVSARWTAVGKPSLALYGYQTGRGPLALTLVVERNRKPAP